MNCFLLGTVISFQSKPNFDLTEPIASRIRQRDTSLRTTPDPSLLVESLLDLGGSLTVLSPGLTPSDVVAQSLTLLWKSWTSIMRGSVCWSKGSSYSPRSRQSGVVRILIPLIADLNLCLLLVHILSGDLILHKRTLAPIKALVYALRRYDVDRTAACLDLSSTTVGQKVPGYMSHKAKIYLVSSSFRLLLSCEVDAFSPQADVHDHIEYALTSLDMYAAMAENLINYTFNVCRKS